MKKFFIVDTGPLIAYLNANEKQHEWIKTQFSMIEPPLFTCEAVISEAFYLLKKYKQGEQALFEYMKRGLIIIKFSLQSDIDNIQKLVHKYRNAPMSIADACLVRMAECINGSVVLTLDNDFLIYRKQNRHIIPTLMP